MHVLDVRGDFACWSRPEMKVERWSYPCPTPSGARGVFDAIYLKPKEFRWEVSRIELLSMPSYIALRRNEVSEVISVRNATSWSKGTREPVPLLADADNVRQQRQTMALQDVHLRLHAAIRPWPAFAGRQAGLDEQFRRRARSGKCFHQPYLGCREFVAFFRLVEDAAAEPAPVAYDHDIGWMAYDTFDLSEPADSSAPPSISLFRAVIQDGALQVPRYVEDAVKKPERRAG